VVLASSPVWGLDRLVTCSEIRASLFFPLFGGEFIEAFKESARTAQEAHTKMRQLMLFGCGDRIFRRKSLGHSSDRGRGGMEGSREGHIIYVLKLMTPVL
jgi:hypothetical protein